MSSFDIDMACQRRHTCPNVRQGLKLLYDLKAAVNSQSDGWSYWKAPSQSAAKLQELLATAGDLNRGTTGSITAAQLKKAISPIRAMVTRQKRIQARFGNKFDFDVDASLAVPALDLYKDCGEGPWDTQAAALKFATAEVGVPWYIARGDDRKWHVFVWGE